MRLLSPMTDPQLIAQGKAIVSLLDLKPTLESKGRDDKSKVFYTSWGTATYIGLALRVARVMQEAERNA